ncbi:MAG: DNA cytosine methyltransferase [Elusimicrobia bacterium]|nr:DNA cytosine methyltransferase [Elusimicrobiota bacterium]
MKTLHLFAGAGGGLLADLILGHEPIAAVEWDPYCCQILRERAAEGWFPNLQVFEGDIRLFDASAWKGRVDCIHAGFPCQPHSVAGKRRGAVDDRNLWPEVVRVLGEIRPRWFFGENVPGLVSNGFIGTVLGDLALLGYDARWTLLGADQVGAPHRRDRWWCLAHAKGREIDERRSRDMGKATGCGKGINSPAGPGGQDVADPKSGTRQEDGTPERSEFSGDDSTSKRWDWWDVEPDVGRVAHGVASRVDRLKGLGNGQVPPCAAAAWIILGGPSDTF